MVCAYVHVHLEERLGLCVDVHRVSNSIHAGCRGLLVRHRDILERAERDGKVARPMALRRHAAGRAQRVLDLLVRQALTRAGHYDVQVAVAGLTRALRGDGGVRVERL